MMLPHLGVPELLIVLVIVLVIFGASRLTDIMGALGRGNPRIPQRDLGTRRRAGRPAPQEHQRVLIHAPNLNNSRRPSVARSVTRSRQPGR